MVATNSLSFGTYSSIKPALLIRFTMALVGLGRVYEYQRGKLMIYLPSKVHSDSAFPFHPGQAVRVRIDTRKGCLVVEPAD